MIEVEGVNFKCVVFDPNNRISRYIYSQEIIDRELSKYVESVKDGTALGRFNPPLLDENSEPYPTFYEINPLNCAFEITNLARKEDGSWEVEGNTLKTPYGEILKSLLVDGVRLKPTLLGTGNVDENNVVGDDFSLIAIDIMPEGTKE
ncbi:MAG: hypothetical protein MJZ34_08415 [Paludibacteraceae bacterium]|nr:hypothetical protein [Paludibacteraceae bacterium]